MKSGKFRAVLALLLAFALALPLWAACAGYRYYYTFSDRHGNTIAALEDAFASKVVSFTHGDPWTEREENQKPENALGLPDAEGDDGDLNLGGGGVLVVEMGLPVRDGSGYDLFVFESGGSVEEMRLAVSDDLATWYDVGTLSGSIAEADLHGITPEGASFRYVRLTDAGKNNSGTYPGADIDAVCGFHTREKSRDVYPYRINSVLVQNDTFRITKEEMTVAVSVTKLAQSESASVFLIAYDGRGQMTGSVSSVDIDGKSVGETFDVTFPVDNRAGNVAQLRAFIVSAAPDMIPLSYPFAYAAKKL